MVMFVSLSLAGASPAQTVSTVFNFSLTTGAGPSFETLTQGRDGKLYGTTSSWGENGRGTVFRFSPATGTVSVLHSFGGTDGDEPGSGLTLATDGNFYGTTVYGGSDYGVLYRISSAGTYTVLHEFLGGGDGSSPYWPPIEASDGNLYGVAGGGDEFAPIVYKLTRSGVYSIVYSSDFSAGGWEISGLMQGSDSLLYTTSQTGGADGCGAIAKFTLTGVLRATHAFNCSNQGAFGEAPLIQAADGNYYGTTTGGGVSDEAVLFQLTSSFGENVLYNFGSTGATNPYARLVQGTDGNLYGTTYSGELYSWNFTSGYSGFYTFAFGSDVSSGLMQDTSGLFYGPSFQGGTHNAGYIYSLNMGLAPFVTFVRSQGAVGSSAQVLGQGLTGTTGVTFNGVAATSFTVVNDTYMTAVVPSGAATGKVVVTTPSGALTSNVNFRIVN
jgi:uncharacterized repeat protein (TIGR03803 family)